MTPGGAGQLPLISLRGVSKRHGLVQSLDGIDLELARGEVVAVLGPTGAGKTTLCRTLNGLERIDAGAVTVAGTPLPQRGRRAARLRPEIGLVDHIPQLLAHLTVLENVKAGRIGRWMRLRHGLVASSAAAVERSALALLDRVGLAEAAELFPWELSDGQQRRVAIARALVAGPELMVFDETTLDLAPSETGEVQGVLSALAADGVAMVLAAGEFGEFGFARSLADRVVFMSGGRILEQAPPEEFFTMPRTARARAFLAGGPGRNR
ncbi:amino acid ABC transporter ATP-binding protein [Streptacidiphilus sp. EB129]|uniref:amino acid ABC transporter ATP-binding protein n=1 Tax=Streptacidiphilus sp. EB129 TaxID=3156262 RepID=UPI003517C884